MFLFFLSKCDILYLKKVKVFRKATNYPFITSMKKFLETGNWEGSELKGFLIMMTEKVLGDLKKLLVAHSNNNPECLMTKFAELLPRKNCFLRTI